MPALRFWMETMKGCDCQMINAEFVGFIAGILGLLAWIPQVAEVWYYQRHEGVSLPTIFTIVTTLLLWTVYGFMIDAVSVILSNMVAGLLILSVAIGVIRLRIRDINHSDN